VKIHRVRVRDLLGTPTHAGSGCRLTDVVAPGRLMTGSRGMDDLVFVILTVAFFALAGLIVKGVERL